jgi:hypothetical protein
LGLTTTLTTQIVMESTRVPRSTAPFLLPQLHAVREGTIAPAAAGKREEQVARHGQFHIGAGMSRVTDSSTSA